MRALSLARPQAFEWLNVPEPARPGPGQVLVAVKAVGICGTDIAGYLGKMPFIECPRILGHELGVEVLEAGEGAGHLNPGDRCSVEPYLNCGHCPPCRAGATNCCEQLQVLGVHRDGGLCEQLLLPSNKLHVANNLSFEQLALVETLAIGCHAVNRSRLRSGETALSVGAGPIGLSVLEFAGLITPQVIVVERQAARRDFVSRHYPEVQVLSAPPTQAGAQVVFDATGNAGSMANAFSLAAFAGRVVYVGITPQPVPLDDALFHRRELTLLASRNALPTDFSFILEKIQAGCLDTGPWITHRCGFADVPTMLQTLVNPESQAVKAVVSL